MSNIIDTYSLDINQIAGLIAKTGHEVTTVVEGDMGSGKSSISTLLAPQFPNHTSFYADMTTKDLGDVTIPNIGKLDNGTGYVTYLTNEEFGVHLDKPIILMIDEFGKANPAVKLAMLRLMLERKIGSYTLHPESIVFATTNLGAEGVGDLLPPHARNRMSVVRMRKPDVDTWLEWGINNGIDPALLGWVKDNPQVFQSFTDVKDPDENPYIYHPQARGRTAFVTPRSLALYSKTLEKRAALPDQVVTAHGIGLIGAQAALDMQAYITLGDQLPTRQAILDDPDTAPIPVSVAAVCMVVFRALSSMDREFVNPWMTYMNRLSADAQGLFVNGVRAPRYSKQHIVMTNSKFTSWCKSNGFLFTADV